MGCRSDYLEATGLEKGLSQAAKLAVFMDGRRVAITPSAIVEQSKEYYAKDVGQVQYLCDAITNMPEALRERVVYDAHSPESRELAIWWEAHVKADADRAAAEQKKIRDAQLRRDVRAKLSPEEAAAVGL